ncbi:AAA family ATPase [Kocuria rosea]|uniref:AAA family ATPase n=1 Tax=Kocuria rosea TaxID=1275 RepID=UPI0011A28B07|nr:AAA family ATPase [Kocuria rosea]
MFTTHKVSSTGSHAFAEYLKEQEAFIASVMDSIASLDTPGSLDNFAAYIDGKPSEHLLFDKLLGTGAAEVLDVKGLTRDQFMDIGNGRWNGKQLCQMSYQPEWETDENGKIRKDVKGNKIAKRDENGKQINHPHRWGFIDGTFSAPKEVMEYAIATTPEVRKIMIEEWNAAVAEGIKAMEERAYLVRRTIKGEYNEKTKQQGSKTERVRGAKLIVVPATQLTARHTASTLERNAAPDPLLHTHNAIATMAFLPDDTHPDGMRPLTIDEAGLKRFAEEVDAVVMGDYTRRLENRGIQVEYDSFEESRRGKVTWRIAGIDKAQVRFHSSNTARRDKLVKEFEDKYRRPPTRVELDNLLRVSRVKKSKTKEDIEADKKGAWDRWKSDLRAHGFDVHFRKPGKPIERASEKARKKVLHDRLFDINTGQSPKGLCRDNSVFTEDQIMASIQRCAVGLGFTQDELKSIEQEVRQEIVMVRDASDERYRYFTTNTQVTKEKRLIRAMESKAREGVLAPNSYVLANVFNKQQFSLDPQQREAVIAASRSAWTHIGGTAGSGKSTVLSTLRESLETANLIDNTVVVSTAAATAQRSGEKVGADVFGSVESIERQVKQGKLEFTDKTLVIIDEAAMMDTDHLDRLMMAAKGKGRFVHVGDDKQLTPIGPAGWYEHSVKSYGQTEIRKVRRQRDPEDVHTYNLLRVGHINEARQAVQRLHDKGRIHVTDDADERQLKVFSDYQQMRDARPKLGADDFRMIIETSNQDVDTMNRMVQFDRKQRGEISGEGVTVNDEESGRSWNLHKGDSVMFLRPFAPRVKGQAPVRNGMTGQILDVNHDKGFSYVKLEDKRIVRVPLREHEKNQPFGPNYAQSAHKIQGAECEVVQVMPGTDHTATANSAYSQLTRAKGEAYVYLDHETHGEQPHQTLAESWAQRVDKRMSLAWLRRENNGVPLEPSAAERVQAAERQKIAEDWQREVEEMREESLVHRAQEEKDERRAARRVAVRERLRIARPRSPEQDATEQAVQSGPEPSRAVQSGPEQQSLIRTGGSLRDRLIQPDSQELDDNGQTPILRRMGRGLDRDNDQSI